jgi:hypothetical protein
MNTTNSEHNVLAPEAQAYLEARDTCTPGWFERLKARDAAWFAARKRSGLAGLAERAYRFVSATPDTTPAPLTKTEIREAQGHILTAAAQLARRTGHSIRSAALLIESMAAHQGPQLPAQNEPPGTPQRKPKPMETHGEIGPLKGSGPPGADVDQGDQSPKAREARSAEFAKRFTEASQDQLKNPEKSWADCKKDAGL